MLTIFVVIKKTILAVLALLFTTFVICTLPITLILLIPFHVCRLLIIKLAKCFRPDLSKILTMRGTLISIGERNNPLYNNIVLTFVLEKQITLEKAKSDWTERVLKLKMANGFLRYPELQQYVCKWMGYLFWKQDKNFNLDNHIVEYKAPKAQEGSEEKEDDSLNPKQLVKLRSELSIKPYPKERSPWELVLVKNYSPDPNQAEEGVKYSAIIFRWHHTLGDGYSIMKLFLVYLTHQKFQVEAKPKYKRVSLCTMLCKSAIYVARKCFKMVYQSNRFYDRNDWHIPVSKVSQIFYLSVPDPIPLIKFKEIATAHDVTVSSVIQAALAGGIRRMMLKKNLRIPKSIQAACPLPLPGHPDKLRTYATGGSLRFPIGLSDPVQRLKKINHNYLKLKTAPLPFMNTIGAALLGACPYWFIRPLSTMTFNTLFLSNFPGPSQNVQLFDSHIFSIDYNLVPPRGNFGLLIIAFSWKGNVHLTISIEKNLLTTESEVDELGECFLEEMQLLQYLAV